MRILVVEDEQAIATFVQQGLAKAGYGVDVAERKAVLCVAAIKREDTSAERRFAAIIT